MHVKSDSEVTSIDASTPPHSPPRRPLYYVQSPSQHDVEKMSYGSSPMGSPPHYHCSPIHHSRESSSTTRFSASIKNPRNLSTWKKIHNEIDDDDAEDDENEPINRARVYVVCFVICLVVLFSLFSLILWGVSKAYKPKITMKDIVFERFNVQAGVDEHLLGTQLLTLTSTVRMTYRNPATFFGVHVSATPVEIYYYQMKLASGHMKEFYQSRKSETEIKTKVNATMVPLYGSLSALNTRQLEKVSIPVNLTFVVRSRAYVLGKLVKPKFYKRIRCSVDLKGNHLGHPNNLKNSCEYS